jgi:hypothetical protein
MPITSAQLRPALRKWAAQQTHVLEALQRALEIVYRDRPGARRVDEIVEALLLRLAAGHETRVAQRLSTIDGALGRLFEDLDELRSGLAQQRTPALREADLHVLAEAMTGLASFEDHVRFLLDTSAPDVHNTLREVLPAAPEHLDDLVTGAVEHRLTSTQQRGDNILRWAEEIEQLRREGRTFGRSRAELVDVPWPDHPRVMAAMERMTAAVDHYKSVRHTDPVAAAHAADELQRRVSRASETLRSLGEPFEAAEVRAGRIPPTVPAARRPVPEPGSVAEGALKDANAVLARLHGSPGLPTAPAQQLFDALHLDDLEVVADGVVGEPLNRRLPGMGAEKYALSGSQIRAKKTSPPWLAERLAKLVDRWERAHLIGPGFGADLFSGLMSAPSGVNQLAQNEGVEAFVRKLVADGGRVDLVARARGRRLLIPLADGSFDFVDVLTSVEYQIAGARPPAYHFKITVEPNGRWRVTHDLPEGVTGADVPLRGNR